MRAFELMTSIILFLINKAWLLNCIDPWGFDKDKDELMTINKWKGKQSNWIKILHGRTS